ncbi:MAG: N-6 DNA methylase [Cyanobacteria bacterium SZAS LIN-5]|nr:N-6 DNA methylase [Cyanobacteria bacterium SZAS LIN-5]
MSPITVNAHRDCTKQDRHASMMKLLRLLRKEDPELKHSDRVFLELVAAAGLAARGILPVALGDSIMTQFIKEYGAAIGKPAMHLDSTAFSVTSSGVFQHCQRDYGQSFIEKRLHRLVKAISSFHSSAALDESLAAGWFWQCAIKSAGVRKNIVDGHRTRAQTGDIPSLTQWFTPDWIADFLVEEALSSNKGARFLDPACGAGHLLVPALRSLLAKQSQTSQEEALEQIFEQQLFGLDVDSGLVDLAKLALYLEARDSCASFIEIAPAKISLAGDSERACTIGSLLLGASVQLPGIPQQFDAIAMNPPYLGHRIMPQMIRDFLKAEFPDSQYDLYAAFLELGLRLLKPGGRLAAICQQSVLTIQRYQSLREAMMQTANVEAIAQLGSGVFATKGGEKTNTAIITLRKKDNQQASDVRCWQLLTKEEKALAESNGLSNIAPRLVSRAEADAQAQYLPQAPYSFWAPPEILRLFNRHPAIVAPDHAITCTNGLFTCNNQKFVTRFDKIDEQVRHEYVPYDKGGGHKWYYTSPLMLHWKTDGQQIREYRVNRGQSARLPGEPFYFKRGVTYSYIGTKGFKARLLTPGAVFDIASSAIFSSRIDILFILGYLNSSLVRSILGVLNPTINFQIGDIRRLPFLVPDPDTERIVASLSAQAIEIVRQAESFDPDSPSFAGAAAGRYDGDIQLSQDLHQKQCQRWADDEAAIQKQLDEIIFDMYEISSSCRKTIQNDPWVRRGADSFRKTILSTCKQQV